MKKNQWKYFPEIPWPLKGWVTLIYFKFKSTSWKTDLEDFVDEFGSRHDNRRITLHDVKLKRSLCRDLCRDATSSSFRGGGAIFMKFHSMTSSCLFNRYTTFSQTVTYNNNVFLPADTTSILYKHTYSAQRWLNKDRTFYNSVGGWITSVKRNFWLRATCTYTEQHSTYKIRWENWWLGLRV